MVREEWGESKRGTHTTDREGEGAREGREEDIILFLYAGSNSENPEDA